MASISIPEMTPKQIETFWSHVTIKGVDDCWEWNGALLKKGYGQLGTAKGHFVASRIAWFLSNRKQPGRFLVCHTCDNPPCCNPRHLFLGSYQDNENDCVKKGRQYHAQGEKCGRSKLKNADITKIRQMYLMGYNMTDIGNQFEVSQTQISRIIKYQRWAHIP